MADSGASPLVQTDLVAEVERALQQATPGPWLYDERVGMVAVYPGEKQNCVAVGDSAFVHVAHGEQIKDDVGPPRWVVDPQKLADARLIAGAPEWLRRLCARVRELEQQRAGLTDELAMRQVLYDKAFAGRSAAEAEARLLQEAIERALHELGVPQPGYPAPVTNAVELLRGALSGAAPTQPTRGPRET